MQHTLFDLGRAQLPPSVLAFASGVNEAREIRAFFLCAKSSTRSGTVSSLIDAIVVGGVVGPGAVTALLPTMRHHRIHHARGFLVASSGMEITQGQKDVRDTFLGGFAGQLVSGALQQQHARGTLFI